jgi:heat shock protein HslJ
MNRYQLLGAVLVAGSLFLAACAPIASGPSEKTIYVGPYQVPCTGVAPQSCLLVREDPSDDWQYHYDPIEGFVYEPGFEYELRILETPVENPPADASSIRWSLLEIVSKERSLEGTTWLLESYVAPEGETEPVLSGTQVTALFAEGRVGGNAGCNSYVGQYETSRPNISIAVSASTMMFCSPEEVMQQEQNYLATLGNAAYYLIQEDELLLSDDAHETILRFRVQETTPLVETDWRLAWYNNGRGGYTSVLAGTEVTALFGEDGSLTGSAGCNNYSSSYELGSSGNAARGTIAIAPPATTRMFCGEPEGIMEQETAYLQAIAAAAAYEIRGAELELTDAGGTRMATFAKAEEPGSLGQDALSNMTYNSEWTQSGQATLQNGEYSEPAAPGSATETRIMLAGPVAYGELSGEPAAAVVLVTDPGGSGTFYELAVVMDEAGEPVHVASAALGDRVQIHSLLVENGQIVVDMVTQGPDDAMCCPTQEVRLTFALEGNDLAETSREVLGSSGVEAQQLTHVLWKWTQFVDPLDKVTIDDPDKYTIEFMDDGQVSARLDCNMGRGTYSAAAGGTAPSDRISIEVLATTKALCPPNSLSDQFVQYLNEAAVYSFHDNKLLLDLPADSGTMSFERAD